MANHPRYAIYYAAPPDSALGWLGASLLGYDAYTGDDLPFPDVVKQTVPNWRDLTQFPRKYGFHATLKAPMVLASGTTEAQLVTACESFADGVRPIPLIKPVVDSISGFIAVIPEQPSVELQQLATDCTRAFDSFRAPLAPKDRARRNPDRLTPRQREYLDRWGYPYVMEEFRFHMTLTGKLPEDDRKLVLPMLRERFSEINCELLPVDRIALFRQDGPDSRFRIVEHFPLNRLCQEARYV